MAAAVKLRPELCEDAGATVGRAVNPLDRAALTLCAGFAWQRIGADRNRIAQARGIVFMTTVPSGSFSHTNRPIAQVEKSDWCLRIVIVDPGGGRVKMQEFAGGSISGCQTGVTRRGESRRQNLL